MANLPTKMLVKILSIKPVKRWVFKKIACRFVAGEEMEDALWEAENLNKTNVTAILNYLGEEIKTPEKARQNTNIYCHLIREIACRKLNARISVKPSQLGLKISENLYFENILAIGTLCCQHNVKMEIDMEEFDFIGKTVKNSIQLKQSLPNLHLRQCLQISAKRSSDDVKKLTDAGIHIRLCKGAYKMPASATLLLPKNYTPLRIIIYANCTFPKFVEVATHDTEIINSLKSEISIQFLKGFLETKISSLQSSGHLMAVYVPFGSEWVPYGIRRLFYLAKNYKKIFE